MLLKLLQEIEREGTPPNKPALHSFQTPINIPSKKRIIDK
jgi:hypothetical protein